MSHQLSPRLLKDINKNYKTLTKDEEIVVMKLAKAGDARSRDKLVNSQLRSILVVADYYANHKTSKDDLFLEGIQGVIRAIDRFDTSKGIRFITYARPWIKHYISQFTMKDDTIRHPSNVNSRIKKQMEELTQMEEPSEEIRIGMVSMSAPMDHRHNAGRGEVLGDTLSNIEEDSTPVKFENQDLVKKLLSRLNKRQLIIFQLHYGLPQVDPSTGKGWINPKTGLPSVDIETGEAMQEDPLSLQAIGDRLDLTRASISLIIINCKKMLLHRFGEKFATLSDEAIESIKEEEMDDEDSFNTIGGLGKINIKFQKPDLQ